MKIDIYIVIENKLQGEFLKLLFDTEKYNVSTILDGVEAYNFLLTNKKLDIVVIMSYQLPNMDGLEIMRKTGEANIDYAYIFLTSDKTVERAIEAMKAGAYDFIPKSEKLQEELIPLVEKTYQRKLNRLEQDKIKKELDEKNKSIANSINYAKRIQGALLPPEEFIKHLIPDHFIFFKPRDVVSGDFYWGTQRDNIIIIAAADCTGHGVPGAFMSMLGITGLNQIVHYEFADSNLLKAHFILNRLRDFVTKSLRQTGKQGEAQDGMDIALCVIDVDKNQISFAGANNPLYLIRNNELIQYDGDPMPIGIHKKHHHSFTNHEITFQQNDVIYIFSDGYMDQFGGTDGRKFLAKNFRELLKSIHDKPFSEQHEILGNTFEIWKNAQKQIDDILVIGFKCSFKQEETNIDNLDLSSRTVLIVEDDAKSSMLLEHALEDTLIHILIAKDGKEAVDICKGEQHIDIILMDINMPRMDGNEAIQRIKTLRPEVVIIAQTAFYQKGEKEKSFKAGCDDYLEKPIEVKKLLNIITKHLKH